VIAFITLTNSGYVDYTLNCLRSLENISTKINLCCYCIGNDGHEALNKKGYKSILIDDEANSNFQQFREGNWSNIVIKKFDIIYANLLTNDYVLYTDGDVVYENNNFISYLLENIASNDVLIQNDALRDDWRFGNADHLCSGFMFIKSNARTLDLFNPRRVEDKKDEKGWGDQIYINEIKNRLKVKKLPLSLFPNGQFFYKNFANINPYLIHFNWVVGHDKKTKMEQFSKWYLKAH
jgi:hypothetical protein